MYAAVNSRNCAQCDAIFAPQLGDDVECRDRAVTIRVLPNPVPDLKLSTHSRSAEAQDFRSAAFRDAAHTLVQRTGCALMLCRQELFVAEGDAEHAYVALMSYKSSGDTVPLLH
jgi:hypothetical protein